MKTKELSANQIITLNDYPVHSSEVLSEYFEKSKSGEELPFVPVIKKEVVRQYLSENLSKIFEEFEKSNEKAEYFMIDGSHRTTALTLAGRTIKVVLYENDEDILEAKNFVAKGQILQNGTLDHNLEENCIILNDHFSEKPYFSTVEQKAIRMVEEKVVPDNMIEYYTRNK